VKKNLTIWVIAVVLMYVSELILPYRLNVNFEFLILLYGLIGGSLVNKLDPKKFILMTITYLLIYAFIYYLYTGPLYNPL